MKNLWVPLSGAIAQQRKVETIANNVANANTPGFKKDRLVFKEYLTALDKGVEDINLPTRQWKPKDFYHTQGAQNAMVKIDGTFTDHSQGQLTYSKNPLDIALQGPGFFEIETPNGIRYTRRGTFSFDSQGFLVNNQGFKVLSKIDPTQLNNDPNKQVEQSNQRYIKLDPTQKVSINLGGDIFSGANQVGRLSIVEFNDLPTLRKEGNGNYINVDNANISTAALSTTARQGFIEDSNINIVEEMSELIKANRHFESIQRAIKAYDNITGKSVNDIARF